MNPLFSPLADRQTNLRYYETQLFPDPEISQGFIDGVPFHGRPTRFFACWGIPRADHPVPGIVLVHGGGATALADWVKHWNQLGFAAISMDTCGSIPAWSPCPWFGKWPRHEWSGPAGWGGWEQLDEPPQDQWIYHAVNTVLRSADFLAEQPGVDAGAIGLTGISWGGILSCITGALRPDFRFVMPVYGGGFWRTPESRLGNAYDAETQAKWHALWNPEHFVSDIGSPFFSFIGSADVSFPLDTFFRTSREVTARTVRRLVKIDYPHDHTSCWQEPEFAAFARAALAGVTLTEPGNPHRQGRMLTAGIGGPPPQRAELLYTRAAGFWADRRWRTATAEIAGNQISAELPAGVTAAFFSVSDRQNCQWSSGLYQDNKP